MKQLDHGVVDAKSRLSPFLGAGDVTNHYHHAAVGGPDVEGGLSRVRPHPIPPRDPLPFMLGLFHVALCFLGHDVPNLLNQRIRVLSTRDEHRQLVPEPLAGRGKIEIRAVNGVLVQEGHLAASRLSGFGPVVGFEQNGAQQGDLNHFAPHAVDLHPIAHTNSLTAHQREPPEKRHDEIF